MAPSVEISVLQIFVWPVFQAVLDGRPLIGGKLYSYLAGTTTPKSTKADPFGLVDNPNPLYLDDQGKATAYLPTFMHLRLFTPDDVLIWEIDNYQWESISPPPDPGEKIMGSSDGTFLASPGAGVIAAPGLVPTGYRCEGITWTITTGFGTSNGLSALLLGDGVANDRFARLTTLTTGTSGGQVNFHSDVTPIEPIPYVILIASEGGLFDSSGSIHITAYWSTLPADVP